MCKNECINTSKEIISKKWKTEILVFKNIFKGKNTFILYKYVKSALTILLSYYWFLRK